MIMLNALTPPALFADIKGLIFDCDGVLFDSLHSNRLYYNAIRKRLGLGPMTPKQEAYVHAHAVQQSLAYVVPAELWEELPRARADVDYLGEILPHLQPEPGLYHMLQGLKRQGYKLGINTNRTSTMSWLVARFGLDRYFTPIVTANDVCAKPHPEGLHMILGRWGLRKNEVAFVGDSIVDARTASAAGVPFWAYKNPYLQAALHIEDFWSLSRGLRLPSTAQGDVAATLGRHSSLP